jgi:hypothetical protein
MGYVSYRQVDICLSSFAVTRHEHVLTFVAFKQQDTCHYPRAHVLYGSTDTIPPLVWGLLQTAPADVAESGPSVEEIAASAKEFLGYVCANQEMQS